MMKLDIVVPFYNEQDCALEVIQQLTKAITRIPGLTCCFYFVDDGSQDNTSKILDDFSQHEAKIHVIQSS